jgi:hypothetical protein
LTGDWRFKNRGLKFRLDSVSTGIGLSKAKIANLKSKIQGFACARALR